VEGQALQRPVRHDQQVAHAREQGRVEGQELAVQLVREAGVEPGRDAAGPLVGVELRAQAADRGIELARGEVEPAHLGPVAADEPEEDRRLAAGAADRGHRRVGEEGLVGPEQPLRLLDARRRGAGQLLVLGEAPRHLAVQDVEAGGGVGQLAAEPPLAARVALGRGTAGELDQGLVERAPALGEVLPLADQAGELVGPGGEAGGDARERGGGVGGLGELGGAEGLVEQPGPLGGVALREPPADSDVAAEVPRVFPPPAYRPRGPARRGPG
jgi:hypothetical protein